MGARIGENSSSTFEILHATPEDAEAIFLCSKRANSTSLLMESVFPQSKAHLTSTEDLYIWRVHRLRKSLQADDLIYYKVVPTESPDRIIGYAGWYKPGHFKIKTLSDTFGQAVIDLSKETNLQADASSRDPTDAPINNEQQSESFPASMDVKAHKTFLAKMDEARKEIWGDDANYWYLGALGVDPEYQRNGIATALLKIGLSWADNDGIPTYLEATPEGALMYPKVGFKKVSEYEFFDGQFIMEYHIRPPPKAR